jgi:hypothetical protein
MGYITEFTPEVGKAIVDAMARSGYFYWACDAVGVKRRRGSYWRELGRQGKEPYASFELEVMKVRASTGEALLELVKNDKGGPQFALAQMFPAEFGLTGRSFQDAMHTILDAVLPRLSESAANEVVDALTAIQRERSGLGEPGVADSEEVGAGSAVIDAVGESVRRELPASTEPER